MSSLRDRGSFETAYAGKAPWDIGKPQGPSSNRSIRSPARFSMPAAVRARTRSSWRPADIDFVDQAIRMARGKASERGLTIEFQVKDAMTLGGWDKGFATVIDRGLFHVLSDEDRIRYVAGLTHITKPGGRLLLLCFSDEEPGTQGPRRVSQREIRAAFDDAWTVEEIRARHADVRPDLGSFILQGRSEGLARNHLPEQLRSAQHDGQSRASD